MNKILGIFRGFPGLGRVVAGVSLLETLRDEHNCQIEIISYLQGNQYLELKGYKGLTHATPMDYCSIGLLPTNTIGAHIHQKMRSFRPDLVVIDGEALILQSLRLSYPELKIVALLNPADVENEQNDPEAMLFFNALYALANLAIVHGLRTIRNQSPYQTLISLNTIIRQEVLHTDNQPTNDIYCLLGGGTVNVGEAFSESTIQIGKLCIDTAKYLEEYNMHIICSSINIYNTLNVYPKGDNVTLQSSILQAHEFYSHAGFIITRSGRNTLSELAYLGLPAISFLSGCQYRMAEQRQNIEALNAPNIRSLSLDTSPQDLATHIKSMLQAKQPSSTFSPGNQQAVSQILQLLGII